MQAGLIARCRDIYDKAVRDHTATIFYILTGLALLAVDWHKATITSAMLTIFMALLFADFVSGIWHLFVDYYPLNYKLGYNKLLFYEGDRGSQTYKALKTSIMSAGSGMDELAFYFKLHHKISVNVNSVNLLFRGTSYGAFAALIYSVVLLIIAKISYFNDVPIFNIPYNYPEYIVFWLFFSVFVANMEYIHYCIHSPKDFPIGGRFIGFMQKIGMIYKTETHLRHHQGEGIGFCFVTGHTNFIINRLVRYLLKKGVISQERWHGMP